MIFDPLPAAISGQLDRWLKDEVLVAHVGVVFGRGATEKGQCGCIIFFSAMSWVVYLQLRLDFFFLPAPTGMWELSLLSPLRSEVFFTLVQIYRLASPLYVTAMIELE